MKNYSEDISRQYHIQVAKGEVGRYVIMPETQEDVKDSGISGKSGSGCK